MASKKIDINLELASASCCNAATDKSVLMAQTRMILLNRFNGTISAGNSVSNYRVLNTLIA